MDDRTMGAALIGGFLIASSASRPQRASDLAMRAQVRRDVAAYGYSWKRRREHAVSIAEGVAGLVFLAYALRAYRAGRGREVVDEPEDDAGAAPETSSPRSSEEM